MDHGLRPGLWNFMSHGTGPGLWDLPGQDSVLGDLVILASHHDDLKNES